MHDPRLTAAQQTFRALSDGLKASLLGPPHASLNAQAEQTAAAVIPLLEAAEALVLTVGDGMGALESEVEALTARIEALEAHHG